MPIDALPDTPNRTTGHATFLTKAHAWVSALIGFTTQTNTLAVTANTAETNVAASKESAATSSSEAATSANFEGTWSSLTGAATVPYVVYHDGDYYNLLNNLADITSSEPGVTGDWAIIVDQISVLATLNSLN